jgi:hypothetical protein
MEDFDDIFGASTPVSSSTPATSAADDEIDALFGLETPDAGMESAVRDAMAADRHAGMTSEDTSSGKASPSTMPGHQSDESFSDIFGESPTNVSSDVVSMFASLNSDVDNLLADLESTPKGETTKVKDGAGKSRPERLFSLSDDEDDDVTEFAASSFRVDSSTIVLDQGSPTPSPRNADKKTTTIASFFSKRLKKKKKKKDVKVDLVDLNKTTDIEQKGDSVSEAKVDDQSEGQYQKQNQNQNQGKDDAATEKETEVIEKEEKIQIQQSLTLPPPQEPVAAMTKTNARMIVARRTRRTSSSTRADLNAATSMTEEEVQRVLERVASLVSRKKKQTKGGVNTNNNKNNNATEDKVRQLCLQLISSETYYKGRFTLQNRGQVWSLLLGVSPHERDRTLENDMLSCDTLRNSADMREECRKAAEWATTTKQTNDNDNDNSSNNDTTKEGGRVDDRVSIGVDVDALTTDMELLMTFWSVQKNNMRSSRATGSSTTSPSAAYSEGSAWLAAPFYSSGLDHTTTVYKCMHAMEGAIVPGMYRRGSKDKVDLQVDNKDTIRQQDFKEWRIMSITLFQLLLKYHDPTLSSHLGMDSSDLGSVISYLLPHAWLHGGFLLTESTTKMSKRCLTRLWDVMIVDSNPMFSWYLILHLLITHRSRLMALPRCLHGIVSRQRSNMERMRAEIIHIFDETFLTETDSPDTDTNTNTNADEKMSAAILGAFEYKNATPASYQEVVLQHLTLDDIELQIRGKRRQLNKDNNGWYHFLLDFYLVHGSDKVMNLPELLEQFQGKEEKLVQRIEKKYAPMRVHGEWRKRTSPCMWVQPAEIVPRLLSTLSSDNSGTGTNNSLRYFVVDCRHESETKWGKFGSAFWIDPKKIAHDEQERSTIMESLEALRGQVRCLWFIDGVFLGV